MGEISKVVWRSANFSSLRVEEWESEFTVFQPQSGKTHFLNQMAMQILADLDSDLELCATEDEICKNLIQKFQLQSTPLFIDQVNKTLRRLDVLGLIEQVR